MSYAYVFWYHVGVSHLSDFDRWDTPPLSVRSSHPARRSSCRGAFTLGVDVDCVSIAYQLNEMTSNIITGPISYALVLWVLPCHNWVSVCVSRFRDASV